jgi:pyruvate dehydrogenase E2 component (dihydrolipoamide acetyltransferase)
VFEFRLPDLGEGIEEVELLAWRVAPGESIAAYQPLCEVESAKAAVELTSPVAGRVHTLRFEPGSTAQRGDVLVLIDTDGQQEEYFGIVGRPPQPAAHAPDRVRDSPPKRVLAAPFVRKRARELGVKLEDVQGSGPQGRVKLADLQPSQVTPEPADDDRIPLKGLRKQIADHMVEAMQRAPQVTSMDLFDVTEFVRARATLAEKPTYLSFFVKAAIEALREVPEANAVVDEQNGAIVLKREYNIGIATAVPGGLVVPVIKGADRLTIDEIGREIDQLANAARERRATQADLSGGTFTITSFGGLPGSPMFATPILNYPEVAILGIGRIDQQPRVVNGQIVVRECVGISFTFDHRVLDGEGAGRFMAALKRYLEQPLELLARLR